jgi:3-hydroxyisobutyrate dehydrogenase-like beta-hydroxyacid dehydrogenase
MLLDTRAQTIGFVGLGTRSVHWAQRLVAHGHRLVVWSNDSALSSHFANSDVETVRDAVDLAKRASTLICAVETGAQVEAVLSGPHGLIEAAAAGDVIVCLSTIDPIVLRQIDPFAASRGVAVLDAPVTTERSGKTEVLKAYVGGDADALDRVRPLLSALVDEVLHCGALGNGLAMKHVINLLAQVQRVLIVEALALGSKAGLDLSLMVDTILSSKGNSVAFQRLAPRILAQNFEGVPMRTTCEDVALQAQVANSFNVPAFITSAALQVYKTGVSMGFGDFDSAALAKMYERCAGVALYPESLDR